MADVLYIHPVGKIPEFARKYYNDKNRNNAGHYFGFIPMGIIGIINNLRKNGLRVQGINLALMKRLKPDFSLKEYLLRIKPRIILIDMHWYVHIGNGIEIARICKDVLDCKVIVGGISATLFYKQLLQIHDIDYVVKGDAELPLLELSKCLISKRNVKDVPNIASMGFDNEISYTCIDIDRYDYVSMDFLEDNEPYLNMFDFWLMVGKGCPYDCEKCDGSRHRTERIFGRNRTVFRKPASIINDLRKIKTETVNFSLDLQLMPEEIIKAISKHRFEMNLRNEFFRLAEIGKINRIRNSFRSFDFVFSPVSGEEAERARYGRNFTNREFLKSINDIDKGDFNGGIIIYFTDYMISPKGTEKLNERARIRLIEEIEKVVPYAITETMPQVVDPGTVKDMSLENLFAAYSK